LVETGDIGLETAPVIVPKLLDARLFVRGALRDCIDAGENGENGVAQ